MRKSIILGTLSVIALCGLVIYEYALPEQSAREYLKTIRAEARQTKTTLENLTATLSDVDFVNNENGPVKRRADMAKAQKTVADAKRAVASIKTINSSLKHYPFSGYIGTYNTAAATQRHAADFISRATTALVAYETVIAQSDTYLTALDTANVTFTEFNSVVDINIYAGRSDTMRRNADQLRRLVGTMQTMELVQIYEAPRSASVAALSQGAQGFTRLADALDNPVDDMIYAAVHEIEDAHLALDTANQTNLTDTLEKSRTTKDLDDLVETIDYIEG